MQNVIYDKNDKTFHAVVRINLEGRFVSSLRLANEPVYVSPSSTTGLWRPSCWSRRVGAGHRATTGRGSTRSSKCELAVALAPRVSYLKKAAFIFLRVEVPSVFVYLHFSSPSPLSVSAGGRQTA